jgi:hypothetical protein
MFDPNLVQNDFFYQTEGVYLLFVKSSQNYMSRSAIKRHQWENLANCGKLATNRSTPYEYVWSYFLQKNEYVVI